MAKGIYVGVNGIARKVKKIYVGVNGIARKVKKIYVGVAGIARLLFSAEPSRMSSQVYLLTRRCGLAAASVGNYALFAGGTTGSSGVGALSSVEAFDQYLTNRGYVAYLSNARLRLAGVSINGYAIFSGGSNRQSYYSDTDAFNSSLTRSGISLPAARFGMRGANVGNYALFAGGGDSSSEQATCYWFSASLTRGTLSELYSKSAFHASATLKPTTWGDHAIFAGGRDSYDDTENSYGVGVHRWVTAYNISLTREMFSMLSQKRRSLAAASVGDYALFAGGGYYDDSTKYIFDVVDAFNGAGTRYSMTGLTAPSWYLTGFTIGEYAIFTGGNHIAYSSNYLSVYDKSLTRINLNLVDDRNAIQYSVATHVGDYILVGGGDGATDNRSGLNTVSVYE